MGDSWRFRRSTADEDIFDGEDYEGDNRSPEVKKSYSKSRDGDHSERHSSKRSYENRHKDKDKERHSHKEHHRSDRRHKKRSKRSRSKSRDRDRSRSRERDRGGKVWRRHHEQDRTSYPGSSRMRFPDADKYSQSSRRDSRSNFRSGVPEGYSNASTDGSKDEEVDDRCPQALLKTIPPEAARLKEEVERRKLLWSKKDKPVEAAAVPAVWSKTAFTDDSDGKVSAKFKRLMGMKEGESSTAGPMPQDKSSAQSSDSEKQAEFLANLEKQYEVARATTHTQRGLGLGFSSSRFLHR